MTAHPLQRAVATIAGLVLVLFTAACNQHGHPSHVASGESPSTSPSTVAAATPPSVGTSTVGLAARSGASPIATALFGLAAAGTHVTGSPFHSVAADLQSALTSARAAVTAEASAGRHNPPDCTQIRQAAGTVATDLNRVVADTSTVRTLADGVSSAVARLTAATDVVQHDLTATVDAATRASAVQAVNQARTLATTATSGWQSMVSHAAAAEQTVSGLAARARALAAKHCG